MADALQLLREDHNKVKELFKRFEEAENAADKKRIADQAMTELEVHAQLEEEVFYPAVRRESDAEDLLMEEAVEEHNVADALIDELRTMSRVDTHYEAKFMVLAEAVKHHIQEEESEMLPKAAEVGMNRMRQLGEQMGLRKQELMQEMMNPERRSANGSTSRSRTEGSRSTSGRRGPASGRARRTTTRARTNNARTTSGRPATGTNRRRTTRAGSSATTRRRTTRAGTSTTTRRGTTRTTRTARGSSGRGRTTRPTNRGRSTGTATRARSAGRGAARSTPTRRRTGTTKKSSTGRSRRSTGNSM